MQKRLGQEEPGKQSHSLPAIEAAWNKLQRAFDAREPGSVEALMDFGNSCVQQLDFPRAIRVYEMVVGSRHPTLAAEAAETLRLIRVAFGNN